MLSVNNISNSNSSRNYTTDLGLNLTVDEFGEAMQTIAKENAKMVAALQQPNKKDSQVEKTKAVSRTCIIQ